MNPEYISPLINREPVSISSFILERTGKESLADLPLGVARELIIVDDLGEAGIESKLRIFAYRLWIQSGKFAQVKEYFKENDGIKLEEMLNDVLQEHDLFDEYEKVERKLDIIKQVISIEGIDEARLHTILQRFQEIDKAKLADYEKRNRFEQYVEQSFPEIQTTTAFVKRMHLNKMTYSEIAEELEIPPGRVKRIIRNLLLNEEIAPQAQRIKEVEKYREDARKIEYLRNSNEDLSVSELAEKAGISYSRTKGILVGLIATKRVMPLTRQASGARTARRLEHIREEIVSKKRKFSSTTDQKAAKKLDITQESLMHHKKVLYKKGLLLRRKDQKRRKDMRNMKIILNKHIQKNGGVPISINAILKQLGITFDYGVSIYEELAEKGNVPVRLRRS